MDPLDITDKARLQTLLAMRKKGNSRIIDEADMVQRLQMRVRGQDHIVSELARFIRLQWGKQRRGKPVASLLFVGPPATGKTELAKAMAEYLFDDEKQMLRFDCSEFSGAEAKTRLIGSPKGYVGASDGGQLTRPMFSNPRRLILFDEIEKAYSGVFDLLLSMLGEGRVTEQASGKVADFTQSVVVLTSNAEHEAMVRLLEQIDDPFELSNAVRSVLKDAGTFRPEIISRFDHVFVFQHLDEWTNAQIAGLKISKSAEEYGLRIDYIEPEIVEEIICIGDSAKDTRELTRVVDAKLGNLFIEAQEKGWESVRIQCNGDGLPHIYESEMIHD